MRGIFPSSYRLPRSTLSPQFFGPLKSLSTCLPTGVNRPWPYRRLL